MERLIVAWFILCAFWCPTVAGAGILSDGFTTNPGLNWCERWHHVLWDSTAGRMKGTNGDDCCHTGSGPVGCCSEGCGTGCGQPPYCVNAEDVFAHLLISGFDFAGVFRSAEITLIFSEEQEHSGQHPAVFSVAHPNCHAGFQAVVYHKAITGNPTNHILVIERTNDKNVEFEECPGQTRVTSAEVNVGTLATGTVPRYKLTLVTDVDGADVEATATLVDATTSTTLGTVSKTFDKPEWYDDQAQRFGFGGGFGSVCDGGSSDGDACQSHDDCLGGGTCVEDPSIFYAFDDFEGTSGFGDGKLYVSFTSSATVPGAGTISGEDIVVLDGKSNTWSLYFDGSDVNAGSDIDAFSVRSDGSVLMSFNTSQSSFPDIGGTLDDSDIVLFTPTQTGPTTVGTFSMFFDGSDVDLTSSSEDIDALRETPDDELLISTSGNPTVTGASDVKDEDILEFTPTSTGWTTAGTWASYFDGSAHGFGDSSYEDVNGISWEDGDLLFTTTGDYNASGGSGEDEDVSTFAGTFPNPPSGTAELQYDLTEFGISNSEEVDGVYYEGGY